MIQKKQKQRKYSILGVIGASFQKFFKNGNIILALPFIFSFIAAFIILVAVILIAGINLGVFAAAEPDLSAVLASSLVLPVILSVVIGLLAIWFISCYFSGGAIGMAYEIINNKKTNLAKMHQNGKQFFFRYWLASLIIGIMVFVWLAIFSLPAIFTLKPAYLSISLLSIIPAVFIFILFTFAYTFLVIHDLSAWKSVKKSVVFVKNNYWPTFSLIVLFSLIMFAIGLIPFIGNLANLIIMSPVMAIAFIIFVLNRSKKTHAISQ